MSNDVKAGKSISTRWSCGNSKRFKVSDRVFLIRLGEEPKGIFASGTITKGPYEDLHWDEDKAATGETQYFVRVQFDTLLNPNTDPILSRELLKATPFSDMHWDTQMSGVHIPDKVAQELEKTWINFANRTIFFLAEEIDETSAIYEGALHRISVNAFERNPEARSKCIVHYGPRCFVCGFDFAKVYGEPGKDFIHVHHLRQISEIGEEYQIDPIRDLRPVCPNCHAIIHRRKHAYTIEEVQTFLHQAK